MAETDTAPELRLPFGETGDETIIIPIDPNRIEVQKLAHYWSVPTELYRELQDDFPEEFRMKMADLLAGKTDFRNDNRVTFATTGVTYKTSLRRRIRNRVEALRERWGIRVGEWISGTTLHAEADCNFYDRGDW